MDMATGTMNMMTATNSMSSAMATSGMDSSMGMTGMSGMDGMDMDMGTCFMSMLLNFHTVGACFISKHWQIGSTAGFAGTWFAVFFLSMCVEGIRRLHREFDRSLIQRMKPRAPVVATPDSASDLGSISKGGVVTSVPQVLPRVLLPRFHEQAVRALLSGSAFMTAFWLMLLGMYYNVYLLVAIFVGNAAGYLVFARDTLAIEVEQPVSACGC